MEAQDETRLERQLKKGVLEMLVLRLVCQKPGHGYELLARMDRRSHGAFRLKEGTLYPILYRLEAVSYTHLDVYKRQVPGPPGAVPGDKERIEKRADHDEDHGTGKYVSNRGNGFCRSPGFGFSGRVVRFVLLPVVQ